MKKFYRTSRGQTRRRLQGQIAASVNRNRGLIEYLDRHGRLYRLKSQLEREFAEGLDRMALTWFYEPHTFLLSDGRRYTPDFFIMEWATYVELKGRPSGLDKVDLLRASGVTIELIRGWQAMRDRIKGVKV